MIHNTQIRKIVRQYLRSKGLPLHIAVTFPDIFLVDRTSRIKSRSEISGSVENLRTQLTKKTRLNIPIISSNMADVTESAMAIAIARKGGLGFIHQFMPIKDRVSQVREVKRADNEIIENPWCVKPGISLKEALDFMKLNKTSAVLVVNDDGVLVGILTNRDVQFKRYQTDEALKSLRVEDVMTKALVTANPGITIQEAIKILDAKKIEKLPLIDEKNQPVGLITAKDVVKRSQFPMAARDRKGRLLVGATVGLPDNILEEVGQLCGAGADAILLDTARANALRVQETIQKIKKEFPKAQLVVGNVDNPEGTRLLIDAGADAVKVGIGPGSACKTREETGVGMPQLTAIAECAAVAEDIPIIADGGIAKGGDFAKALAAGASVVMLGSALAGTDESPGELQMDKGQKFKVYRGSASLELQLDRLAKGSLDDIRAPEGEPRRVPYKGSVGPVIEVLIKNLSSAMSYVNALTLAELRECQMRWQTRAGHEEGMPKS